MFTSVERRGRGGLFAAGALALAVGATGVLVATAPAQADTTIESGALHWGFKQSFRAYVGNQTAALPPIGALPVADRITLTAPATFDPATPAVPTTVAEAQRPYIFAADSGEVTSSTDAEIHTSGGVSYNFPSHFFTVKISNPTVKVEGTTATIYADTYYDAAENEMGFESGHFEGTQVPLATSSTVTVSTDGDTATVSATGVTLTAEGATAVPLYAAGDPLDNFTATVALEAPETPAPTPTVSLSKDTANPAGDTITVTGHGFAPTNDPAAIGTRPPLSGQFGGFYVVFGKFQENWKPSAGAPSGNRLVDSGAQKWAYTTPFPSSIASAAVELTPAGDFTATLNVRAEWGSVTAASPGLYGIYTYSASGAAYAGYETFTPVTFVSAPAGSGQQSIVATIPSQPGGEFGWTISGGNTATLGAPVNHGAYLEATGEILPVVVTDTRTNQANSWSLNGQVSDFWNGATKLDGKYLGWTPSVDTAGAGATAGAPVASGYDSGNGLKTSSSLVSGADGHAAGSATVGADLQLKVPAETAQGTYTALLTLTALG